MLLVNLTIDYAREEVYMNKKSIKKKYREMLRHFLNLNYRKKLKNSEFSIISSNCCGGVIYHELGCMFLSPTIDLWFEPFEFLRFVESLEEYISLELVEERSTEYEYPVGLLGDVHVYFMHYESFALAKKKWDERKKRINWENLYIIMTEWEDSSNDLYERFEKLPYENKVLFTAAEHKEYPSTYCLPEAKKEGGGLIDILKYKSLLSGKRYLDDFDFVAFLNKE